ncbi:5'-3' exoribonuclease 1 [Ceratocystis fimbriata CBS 114723]|uniref:5'-3' exoribonuclease 1 n=1 Tax=Ceratocystis fimbriata CBS 114723 TaxID=1035309 RepID=A0A2C5XHA2_9PEZI|nr:5'-3' exoribonuclease 1 [Ceratocystis fimbriata CBS 114723]
MGVPKFFRWISERYPPISQLIAENRIPEFDCLYLDMNGIIHNCTHKDAGEDATFRLTEEEMFLRIFSYIEHLFSKIKPKNMFFMAIDGVAPRAKMNQQRARRFRTALDAENAREEAIKKGVEMPKEPAFDSNCITPGTEFMQKLSNQLKYFVNKKISEDSDWQRCDVVLSGHEVPGEGEHKIMEYIRNAKAQPGYNPNMRHCLYGLDADLIMLGLLSHDPHFCLLREEVTFGRASKNKSTELERQNFYLLHLCIVREYLELEFRELAAPGALTFDFDLERVIDDFILMAFFVGNDFLPNLPRLHINEGALASMFRLYKQVLPKCDGYINEDGVINIPRLVKLVEELAKDEKGHFEDDVANESWFQSKKMEESLGVGAKPNAGRRKAKQSSIVITRAQSELWKQRIKPYVQSRSKIPLNLGDSLPEADRKFVQDVADKLHMPWSTKENDKETRDLIMEFPPQAEDDDEKSDEEEEGSVAVYRVIKQYDSAKVIDPIKENAAIAFEDIYKKKFQAWKTKYYLEKFKEWAPDNYETDLTALCENYVQGLQWVLYYYYRGIASWPWFYQYHYSPLTSDIVKGINANLNFKKGAPFLPFEQLMGVLPDRSKSIVPSVYWPLMTDPKSPIIDFYPRDFELDMNGKKMEWEAVVKIPFIDEERLLSAMAPINETLPSEEAARNTFGVALKFSYSAKVNFVYPSSMPGHFSDIATCHCVENIFDLPSIEGLKLHAGLMPGAKIKAGALAGFPSLYSLPCSGVLVEGYGVNVFQSDSRNPSMIITLTDADNATKIEANKTKLGKRCFVGYPFLQEARIVQVSDEMFDYRLGPNGEIKQYNHSDRQISEWSREASYIENWNSKRMGFEIGSVETLVKVEMLKGLVKTEKGAMVKEYAENLGVRSVYAAQTIVDEVCEEDERFIEKVALPIEEEFPVGSKGFFLGEYSYGQPLAITGYNATKANIRLSVKDKEPEFTQKIILDHTSHNRYTPAYAVARNLGINPLLLSRITSSYQIETVGGLRVNLGLNLKFEGKRQKVLGYSRKSTTGWEFSHVALDLITQYMISFPDFFAQASRHATSSDVTADQLWPDKETAQARVKEIVAWLKGVGIQKLNRVPLDAEQLDSNLVTVLADAGADLHARTEAQAEAALQAKAKAAAEAKATSEAKPTASNGTQDKDESAEAPTDTSTNDGINAKANVDDAAGTVSASKKPTASSAPGVRLMQNVPRNAILKSIDAEATLSNQKFQLGDRVVFVASSGKVPLNYRGTVVGISRTATAVLLDVVWDVAFMGGTNLDDRCPGFRGQTVASWSVLNLTNKQLVFGSKAAGSRNTAAGISLKGSDASGVAQYKDAPMPPALSGGWKSAVSNQNGNGRGSARGGARGGRGRGGSNKEPQILHSSLVYRHHPDSEQNGRGSGGSGNNNNNNNFNSGRGRGRGGFWGGFTNNGPASQQSYNAVPPPNLDDTPRGSRGGSRNRGRGGRGGRGNGNRGGRGGRGGAGAPAAASN